MIRDKRDVFIYGSFCIVVLSTVLVIHFLGLAFYVITGASMQGAVPKGAVAIERRVPSSGLQVGDVITFRPPDSKGTVTHRIVAISADQSGRPVYETKGDANKSADPWRFTLDRPVQTKLLTSIPYLGYFLAFFTLRAVRTAMLAGAGVALIIFLLFWFRQTSDDAEDSRSQTAAG